VAAILAFRRKSRRSDAPKGHMPIMDHLGELRRRILISALAVTVAAIVMFFFSNAVIEFLVTFYKDATHGHRQALIVTGPTDGFVTRLKVATYGGIVLALPVWLYQLWRFITPGLSSKERKYAVPFVLASIVLFVMGAAIALLTLEPALKFLIDVGGSSQRPLYTSDRYLSLVSLMIVAFGLSFEFPVVLVFLLIAGVLKTAQLRHARRWAIVGIVVFAAVITPSQDPYSLFFMAAPMYLFYETSIVIGRILKK
jgi:sec-independent protein translocase protein TatC